MDVYCILVGSFLRMGLCVKLEIFTSTCVNTLGVKFLQSGVKYVMYVIKTNNKRYDQMLFKKIQSLDDFISLYDVLGQPFVEIVSQILNKWINNLLKL